MNLGQLATAVGQRLGTDTSSAATRDGQAVRSSLSLRHDQLYRAFLWKDSVLEYVLPINQPYTPNSNYMPSKGRVICPSIMQLVLGVRLGCESLNVQRPMLYYRADYARFMENNYTKDFMLLSAAVWEFDTVQNLILTAPNAADNGVGATLDELQADEVSIVRSVVSASALGAPAGTTDRVDSFIKPVTQGPMLLQVGGGANLIPSGSTYATGFFQAIVLQGGTQYLLTPGVNETMYAFPFLSQHTLTPGVPVVLTGGSGNLLLYSNGPDGTPVTATLAVYQTGTTIATLNAGDTSAPLCQRIQLVATPTSVSQQSKNLHILGKRVSPPFSSDSDIPGISGLEGILVALAYYDFKQRDEQGGSGDAGAALNEAVGPTFLQGGRPGGWLGKLIESEVIQAAYNARIVPEYGVGGSDRWCDYPTKGNPGF